MATKVLQFRRPGVIEAEVSILENGKCKTQVSENLTIEQKRQLVRGLRKLQRELQSSTNPTSR